MSNLRQIRVTVLCLLLLAAFAARPQARKKANSQPFDATGWVSDEVCKSDGAHPRHEQCANRCKKKGTLLVFVRDDNHAIFHVRNQSRFSNHLAEYVWVKGSTDGNTLYVDSVEKLVQPGASAPKSPGNKAYTNLSDKNVEKKKDKR